MDFHHLFIAGFNFRNTGFFDISEEFRQILIKKELCLFQKNNKSNSLLFFKNDA